MNDQLNDADCGPNCSTEHHAPAKTNPVEYVGVSLRDRLEHLAPLLAIARGEADTLDQEIVEGLDLGAEYEDHELQNGDELVEAAEQRIWETPLCVETTTTFEIVLGTGGPDDRFLIECVGDRDAYAPRPPYEVRMIHYRYSWEGSAERRLHGADEEVAEELARRLIPELSE